MDYKEKYKDNWRELLVNECKIRGYSQKTIKTYCYFVGTFLNSPLTFKEYLLKLINKNPSDSTIRTAAFSIKFFLNLIDVKDQTQIPNYKKHKKLPTILSKEEINRMIFSTPNLKYRLLIKLAYSAGLRVSELINLKYQNLDFERNIINIRAAKGKKDRIVMLSPQVKNDIQNLSPKKEGYIFLSQRNKKYSTGSIQKIVSNLAKKANIKKKVTPHTFRHSFATHLLERGIGISQIQKLLGHSRLETTQVYTKVSNKDISKIKTPLED